MKLFQLCVNTEIILKFSILLWEFLTELRVKVHLNPLFTCLLGFPNLSFVVFCFCFGCTNVVFKAICRKKLASVEILPRIMVTLGYHKQNIQAMFLAVNICHRLAQGGK